MEQPLSIPNPERRERLVENLRAARIAFHEVDQMFDEIIAKFDEKEKLRIKLRSNSVIES